MLAGAPRLKRESLADRDFGFDEEALWLSNAGALSQ